MHPQIREFLNKIASEKNISIRFAAEASSRAWGFHSKDSDYDIRFIYTHKTKHYLSFDVELKRDVIEIDCPHKDWDVRGWDIRKALGLFTQSNASLLEWLRSPVVHIEPDPEIQRLEDLAQIAFDPQAVCYHYYRMGRNNAREFIRGQEVSLKKYLYVLRSLVAVDFVREKQQLPSVNFENLLENTASFNPHVAKIEGTVLKLIEQKRRIRELGEGSRIPELDRYIERSASFNEQEFQNFRKDDLRQRKWDTELNKIFRYAVGYDKTLNLTAPWKMDSEVPE